MYVNRNMLQAGGGGGSGGGVSPAGGGGGGDVARSLAGQVKALRSRVEELLERARDAEVCATCNYLSLFAALVIVCGVLFSSNSRPFMQVIREVRACSLYVCKALCFWFPKDKERASLLMVLVVLVWRCCRCLMRHLHSARRARGA